MPLVNETVFKAVVNAPGIRVHSTTGQVKRALPWLERNCSGLFYHCAANTTSTKPRLINMKKVLTEKDPATGETRIVRDKDGHPVWVKREMIPSGKRDIVFELEEDAVAFAYRTMR